MIERYAIAAGRIRQESTSLERVIDRAEWAELLVFADFLESLAQTE